MFDASHSDRSTATPAAVWALWSDPARWPEWNEQLTTAEVDGELAIGAAATIKFKRGGKMTFNVLELETERLLLDEAKLIGCRFGHEHRLEPKGAGVEITHRLYLEGPLSGVFATMFGRRRLRKSVVSFIERERALAEPEEQPRPRRKRRRK